jgi:lysyl-tRNA synthetase class 2
LEKGVPPSGGIALGMERLYMALHGVNDIRELRLFQA